MNNNDRRSGEERRNSKRLSVNIDVEWETLAGRHHGALSDLSHNGCFVLSSGEVEDSESVRILIPLEDGMKVQFTGRVANHVVEIGFGVEFEPLTPSQVELLDKLTANN